jgi:hypothetical protein
VKPLTDEDRLTIVRWIDLGCPIDLDPKYGWMLDDQRPTLSLFLGKPPLERMVIGMYDYGGLDEKSLSVTAAFAVNGLAAGTNLAPGFKNTSPGVWELPLRTAVNPRGKLVVSVQDKQGNTSRIERTFPAK